MKIERLSKFYKEVQDKFLNDSTMHLSQAFNVGFYYGLAEKVYVGACPAAMTVSFDLDENWDIFLGISKIFGLYSWLLKRDKFWEYWLFKYDFDEKLFRMYPDDNIIRARLCGYNPEGINPLFDLERTKK